MLLPREVEGRCVSRLTRRGATVLVSTQLAVGAQRGRGLVQRTIAAQTADLEAARVTRELIRESFYRAFVSMTGERPPWGSLSGVKPGKVASRLLAVYGDAEKVRVALQRQYHLSPERAALCVQAAQASAAVKARLSPEEISLYIGIPFCPTRCHYCSFVSKSTQREAALIEPYLHALHTEITHRAREVAENGQRVAHLYIGGGTPTTLSARQLDDLLAHSARQFDLSALREYTVEAGRPDTCTPDRLAVLKAHGVTRVSVNPQSMQPHVLSAIGRAHTVEAVYAAVEAVRRVGFDVLNMDLIAGLPGDSYDGFAASLAAIRALAPENITVHTLARKRGAESGAFTAQLPSGEETAHMLQWVIDTLPPVYRPYYLYRLKYMVGAGENVGWSMDGCENAYNICMMDELHTVLGLGAGAAGKLHYPGNRIERTANPKYPLEYIKSMEARYGA